MEEARLPTELWMQAHLRRCMAEAVPVYVLRKGDPHGGMLLLHLEYIHQGGTRLLDLDYIHRQMFFFARSASIISAPDQLELRAE